jgi:sodium/potassium-transporting ATPase subunit alpha
VDIRDQLNYELELKNFHLVSTEGLARTLETSLRQGLTRAAADARLKQMGPNLIEKVNRRPMWLKCLFCFVSGFNLLLWVAVVLVFLSWKPFGTPPTDVYNLALAIALLLVISISSLFTFYQVL